MRVSRSAAFVLGAFGIASVLVVGGQAHSQINASPSWVPIGASASGSSSTVWFHEPASRQVVACTAVEGKSGSASTVQCAQGKLP